MQGDGASGSLPNSTVLGEKASSTVGMSTVVGTNASAQGGARSTVVGYDAKAQDSNAVAIGAESVANSESATAVGYQASSANSGVAVGTYAAAGQDSVSVGLSSKASARGSTALGLSAESSGVRSVAIGGNTKATGEYAVAAGSWSSASAQNSVAIGVSSKSQVADGVALGSGSQAVREAGVQGYVPEGTQLTDEQKNSSTWKSTRAEVSVGSNGNTRQVTNVAAGSEDTDAVNVAQLKAVNSRIQGNVDSQLQQVEARFADRFNAMSHRLDSKIENVRDDANAGVAMALAVAGLPQAYLPGKSMFSMAAGTYLGEQGYAMGLSHVMDNGHVVLKVTGSGNSQGHFGGSVGAGFQW